VPTVDKTASSEVTLDYRYGKPLDIERLKGNVLKSPEEHVARTQERIALFQDSTNLVEVNKCYVCGGNQYEGVLKLWGVQFVQCVDCEHVFLTKRLSDKSIKQFYKKDKFYASTYADPEVTDYRKNSVAAPKVEYALEFIGNQKESLRWLDVGAGSGETVSVLQDKGHEAIGIELSETSCAFAKKQYGIDLQQMTLAEYAADNSAVADVISFFGVFEHLNDPMQALQIADRLLKRGGTLIAQVPNFASLSTRIQSAFPQNIIRHIDPVGHMMLYTENSLKRIFQNVDVDPQGLWYFGMDMHELMFNLSIQEESFRTHEVKQHMYDHLNYLQAIIDRSKLSDSMVMVGTKR